MIKLSDYVIQFVANLGVKHIFMLPGGGAMHLNDSVGKCENLQYVCNLHEQACAIAAEAYARLTNNLGVALITSGPGGTNTITGVAGAWLDSTPCLFISGQVKRSDLTGERGVRMIGVQEIDIVSIVKPITKYAVTIMEPKEIRYHLEKAVFLAKTGRPGPVWIDIPLDVQAFMVDSQNLKGFDAQSVHPSKTLDMVKSQISEVIELLNNAQKPVILAGNGIRLANADSEFLQLTHALKIPVLTTRLGVDLISHDDDSYVGMPGSIASRAANFTLQNSDWLLILGARLDMALIAYAPEKLARAAKKIMVNIDPAEINKLSGIIDIPIVSDAKLFILEFLHQRDRAINKDRSAWIQRIKEWKHRYPFVTNEHRNEKRGISIYRFSEILSEEMLSEDIVLPGNSGFACEIFLTAMKVKYGQRVFHNKGTGAMGFCQPAAIGACLGGNKRRTICVDGDGGFQMNIQELETVKRLDLPIKFFVINNNGYTSIRSSQQAYFGRLTGADSTSGMTLPSVFQIASAYGIRSDCISDVETIRAQIHSILEYPGPVVCEVVVVPDELRQPRVSSVQRPDGSMVSKPLEDMWPFLDRDEFGKNMLIPVLPE